MLNTMKRRQPQDTRLNWRDPNMPVLKLGFLNKQPHLFEVDPDKVRAYYEAKMLNHPAPHYKNDPTYFLKKLK